MRVRWTTDAADDLERICDYIATSRPGAAQDVAATIVRRIADLENFHNWDVRAAWTERES
jgi:plasmid stabilization system protein ParE